MQNNRILSFEMAKVLEAKDVEQVTGAGINLPSVEGTYQDGSFDVHLD